MGKNINNPALKESAKEFNQSLLDEQAKKIEGLEEYINNQKDEMASMEACLKCEIEQQKKENASLHSKLKNANASLVDEQTRNGLLKEMIDSRNETIEELQKKANKYDVLGKQFKHLADVLHKKNQKIEELRNESSKHLRDKIKVFYENQDLEKKVKDSLDMMDDAYSSCHIMKKKIEARDARIKALTEKLASITENNVNAQALKSAEHALVEKDAIIQEKDEVIDDLGKELAETKKMIGWVRNASKEYCDYGVAANDLIKELSRLYVVACNDGSFSEGMLERCKNYQTYGFHTACNSETKKEIDEIASGKNDGTPVPGEQYGEPKDDSLLFDELVKKTMKDSFKRRQKYIEDFIRNAGSKGFNGINDRMENCETTGDVTVIMKTIL